MIQNLSGEAEGKVNYKNKNIKGKKKMKDTIKRERTAHTVDGGRRHLSHLLPNKANQDHQIQCFLSPFSSVLSATDIIDLQLKILPK